MSFKSQVKIVLIAFLLLPIITSNGAKKQSEWSLEDVNGINFKNLNRPFRMAKLNFVWKIAQQTLSETKLRSFYLDIRTQDKEMLAWKNTQKKHEIEKEGFKDYQMNVKLAEIMDKYHILDQLDSMKVQVPVKDKTSERLTEPKLKSLYMELKIQDKEEIAYKQLNAQTKDKEGLKSNELRRKLIGIMSSYDLLDHFEDTQDPVKTKPYKKFHESDDHVNKSMFKDKKLNRLWEKAELSGFTSEELNTLKEEFHHHQDKVDVYYSLLEDLGSMPKSNYHENAVNEDELENFNMIPSAKYNDNEIPSASMEENTYHNNINQLRDQHRGIKDHYDRLERMVSSGPHSQDFIEPKVQGLWRVAKSSNFSEVELESIKNELHHFESRLLKLRHLHAEHAMQKQKYKNEKHQDKNDRFEEMEDHIKKQTRKVEKIQENVESQIFRHTEL